MIWIIVAVMFVTFVACVFYYEAKYAPTIDEKEPFLWDDYDQKKDPSLLYHSTYCKNCKFFDKTAMCLHQDNLGEISDNKIKKCKKESYFEVE